MQANDTAQKACNAMHAKHVGSVLVVDAHQRLLGIFTGRDAVRLLANGKGGGTSLANAMTPNPVTVIAEQRAIDALRAMSDGGFRHVPVVENERIVGVVSRADFKGQELDRLEEEEALAERIW
jgi:CBS domain-containing protein